MIKTIKTSDSMLCVTNERGVCGVNVTFSPFVNQLQKKVINKPAAFVCGALNSKAQTKLLNFF